MATINGVFAENVGFEKVETKKPTMADVLNRMEANFANNQAKIDEMQNKTNHNVEMFGAQGGEQSDILSMILPLFAKTDNQAEIKQNLIGKLLESSGNPMLSQLFAILPKIKKNHKTAQDTPQNTQTKEPEHSKIDQFVKTDDYAKNLNENVQF